MSDENDSGRQPDSEDSGGKAKPPQEPDGSTFTQDDVTRIAAREKDQGKRSGQREILDMLGVESVDDVKSFMDKQREAEEARMTEADKAKKAAERDKAEAEAIRAEALAERYNARVERELLKAGVAEGSIAKVSRLVEVDDPANADSEVITAAVADLRKEMPQLFQPEGKSGRQANSDPGKAPGKKPDADPSKRARSRLEERHGSKLKQSN